MHVSPTQGITGANLIHHQKKKQQQKKKQKTKKHNNNFRRSSWQWSQDVWVNILVACHHEKLRNA